MPEFVRADAGFVAPFPDVAGMGDRVADLLTDPDLRARTGDCGRSRVRREHDVAVGAPALFAELRREAGW